jgi:hypothetical protein
MFMPPPVVTKKSGEGDRKINLHAELLQDCEKIQLPKARIERRLKFLYKLAVPILKAAGPPIHHLEVKLIALLRNRAEVWILLGFPDNRREEIHENHSGSSSKGLIS